MPYRYPRIRRVLLILVLAAAVEALGIYKLALSPASSSGSTRPQHSASAESFIDVVRGRKLAETSSWQRLTAVWATAGKVASGEKGPYPFDRTGRENMLESICAGRREIDTLEKSGLLTAAEAALLRGELERLVYKVARCRTVERRDARAHGSAPVFCIGDPPLRRLTARLAALEKFLAEQKIPPNVGSIILASIEGDLRDIREAGYLQWLSGQRRRVAEGRDTGMSRYINVDYRRNADETVRRAEQAAAALRTKLGLPAVQPGDEG